jgi:hypothetical protein
MATDASDCRDENPEERLTGYSLREFDLLDHDFPTFCNWLAL